MPEYDIPSQRQHNQLISDHRFTAPAEALRWLIAVQAQDFFGALWALGLRLPEATLETVAAAFEEGRILRTHMLRPTWHFVAAEDIRWIQGLTSSRVHQANAYMYRQQMLDARIFARAHTAIAKALEGGRFLTRNELAVELGRAGIEAQGMRLAYIVMHAELETLICSGPRRGAQFTYALLNERAPSKGFALIGDEAHAEFTRRYFASRGPATIRDLAYWSSLTLAQANAGLAAVKSDMSMTRVGDQEYWFSKVAGPPVPQHAIAHLLPNYDEYTSSYKERGAIVDEHPAADLFDYAYTHLLIIDGLLVGSWRRVIEKTRIRVQTRPIRAFSEQQIALLQHAAQRYESFLGKEVRLEIPA